MPESTSPFTVENQYNQVVVVYSTASSPVTTPPSTEAGAYQPVYTRLGTVGAAKKGSFSATSSPARIVITRETDDFPLALAIVEPAVAGSQAITVNAASYATTQKAWKFYQSFASEPFQPASLQFSALVLDSTNTAQLDQQVASFFTANGDQGVDLGVFSIVSHWATNSLQAFPGAYWCYEPAPATTAFVLPTEVTGQIEIRNGTATYTAAPAAPAAGGQPSPPASAAPPKPAAPAAPAKPTPPGVPAKPAPPGVPVKPSSSVPLTFSSSTLASAHATPASGIQLTGIVRDLTWEGHPDQIVMCFLGTNDGKRFVAQPYQNLSLPWYAVAYDMLYGAFTLIQIAMALDMATFTLKQEPTGETWLQENASKLIDSIWELANKLGDAIAPESAAGEDIEAINVDVNIDTDTDIDVDIDIDIDVDIDVDVDVDVDVDIDIDVDVDFLAIVDVDVDVDIDIDVDVVTDTDTDVVTDVDTDVDVDVDIDTDVNVQPGMIGELLNTVGSYVMKELPALLKEEAIEVALDSAVELLKAWQNADEQGVANLQPRQSTGLGLLINTMFNEQVPVQARWQTFANFVQVSAADSATVQMIVAAVLMTKNPATDTAAANWRWSTADQNAAVAKMTPFTGANAFQAFQALGAYTFNGQVLPVKVGAQVAMAYLKSAPAPAAA
jgi:hypothetical protein